jgi:hypothetical protein
MNIEMEFMQRKNGKHKNTFSLKQNWRIFPTTRAMTKIGIEICEKSQC